MPHAHHFLERLDRVTRAHAEFLLELYRDHEALKYILQHVNVPASAERVALAVDDPRQGPFAIVTREGKFVTCLGVGMRHEHPVVPRGQLDALIARVADKRERHELALRELRPDEDEEDLFHRLFTRGRRVSREDFVAVTAFEQILGMTPFLLMVDIGTECVHTRVAIAPGAERVVVKGTSIKALEKQDCLEWAIGHLMLLVGAAERRDLDKLLEAANSAGSSPSYFCSAQCGTTWILRSAWAAARLGKGALATYKNALDTATEWNQLLDAAFGLAAIGLRHAALLGEVTRFLEGHKTNAQNPSNTLFDAGRALVAMYALGAIDEPEDSIEKILGFGRQMCVEYGSELPDGHPYKFARPEDVPLDLARALALSYDGDAGADPWIGGLLVRALPLAARAAAEDFYFPRDAIRAWLGKWDPQEQIDRLKRFASKAAKKEPVRAEQKVGRNDPCTCGSGKKWKKCHGSANPPS